ncbi:uncharacterized protein LOC127788082 [Diospyros lotus]|uniref:uncharacterized protein LOC127788082 n=1 Tax=Diospyros lotus TaxID=55363 RepID=UPI002258A3E9|nr:uncharacterized protein LOC127788082 [Diospyros lotus]
MANATIDEIKAGIEARIDQARKEAVSDTCSGFLYTLWLNHPEMDFFGEEAVEEVKQYAIEAVEVAEASTPLNSSEIASLAANVEIQPTEAAELPEDKLEARRLRARVAWYCIYDDRLYKRGFSAPLLRCIDGTDCQTVLKEIHAGHCDNHARALSLAQKALRQGFYWPTIKQDAIELVKRCDKCQMFAKVSRAPLTYLKQMSSP